MQSVVIDFERYRTSRQIIRLVPKPKTTDELATEMQLKIQEHMLLLQEFYAFVGDIPRRKD